MMHRFFYHNFRIAPLQDAAAALLTSFALGAFLGSVYCLLSPAPGLYEICIGVIGARPGLISQLLCGLLPVLLAGALAHLSGSRWALLLPPLVCGFLFSFLVCALVYTLHMAGWLFAALLLAGRGVSLGFLFWFLLRRFRFGGELLATDLLWTCGLTSLCILVFHWLSSPVLDGLAQSSFIPS